MDHSLARQNSVVAKDGHSLKGAAAGSSEAALPPPKPARRVACRQLVTACSVDTLIPLLLLLLLLQLWMAAAASSRKVALASSRGLPVSEWRKGTAPGPRTLMGDGGGGVSGKHGMGHGVRAQYLDGGWRGWGVG